MRVLLAPDKFRGTFTAAEVCAHLASGLRASCPGVEIDAAPMADGGEGTLDVLLGAAGGTRISLETTGPDGAPLVADYGVTRDGLAVIESARFCGLGLVPVQRRDPTRASSRGLGQAIAAALDAGASRLVVGLGGTATVDAGVGMAQALGYRFLGDQGVWDGTGILEIPVDLHIDESLIHDRLREARFTALCDVDNPLLGPRGAAPVFAPQKGATPGQVARLEAALEKLLPAMARLRPAAALTGDLAWGGAGGGLGLGCLAFLGASLSSGAIYLMKSLGLAERMETASLVVTGEGSFDGQTRSGKVVAAVLEAAARAGKPAVVIAGRWDGSFPSFRPDPLEILTPWDLREADGTLTGEGLVELGGRIGREAGRLAKGQVG